MRDLKTLLPLMAALLAAGMWLGRLEMRVMDLESHQRFEHGTYTVPKEQ